jgi:DNA gyrase subunit A
MNTNEKEQIIRTEYSELMKKSYIDYSMSVIVERALPDVRDGLKPVQRRTLYDMYELGIHSDRPYRKSARIVGDTMGKYHPHGDSSIYDALVVMSQDFKKGLPLVDGHGNFGNIEGDGAAAMRYTEARLQAVTEDAFLADLDKDVVDFVPNFDETEKEPSVLPVRIPNLLINGADGIAVGMATSIPPHNLHEVIEATKAFMLDPSISTRGLMHYIKGPDFPTGGIVTNKDELAEIYETGLGKIRIRGKLEEEKGKNGHTNLVITEIPYPMIGLNISKFLMDVAALAEEHKTNDIVDITNQSSKEGIRIVIELRKDADVENFKNLLYKKTRLEDTFGVNMLAICNGKPETMGIRDILQANVDFQFETAKRKYNTLLQKEREKKEIQEGLIRACEIIDLIIEILRGCKDRAQAKNCLVNGVTDGIKFRSKESGVMAAQLDFTEKQADAILDMRLYKLIGLELEALVNAHEETMANIYRYEDILERHDSMAQVIINDLDKIEDKYSRPRRTVVTNAEEAVYEEKQAEDTAVCFVMDRFGYARVIDQATYDRNSATLEQENRFIVSCRSSGRVCLFTNKGMMHTIKVADLPMTKLRDKGIPVDNISKYDSSKESIIYAASQSELNLYRLMFVTRMAMAKIVDGGEFDVSKYTIQASKLKDDDEISAVMIMTDISDVVLHSENGYYLKLSADQIPQQKKNAAGVKAMKLAGNDHLRDVYFIRNGEDQHIVDDDGHKADLCTIKNATRGTRGVKIRK